MSAVDPIRRDSIVDQVHGLLSQSILEGRLSPDTRLNEVHLAGELGVSRTPLREALSRLRQAGLVVAKPNRGFFVAPLSGIEARDLYEVLALLEADALELAMPMEPELVKHLVRLNEDLAKARSAADVIERNTRWHRTLTGGCPNRMLQDLIEGVRTKLLRYEFRFFAPGRARIEESMRRHRQIIDCVGRDDAPGARAALQSHWMTDLDELMATDDVPLRDEAPPGE